jgi:hypothetical protein
MKALTMEFYKLRRRKVWLIVALMIGVQLMWALRTFTNIDASRLDHGWLYCLYQFPILNAIMMPVIAAVVASRISDMEHKGQTLKLIKTIMPAGRLFDAKFLCGSVYMVSAALLQLLIVVAAGIVKGFGGDVPVVRLGCYFIFTVAVSLTILLFQQILSLMFANQMISLSVGLIGSFAGLFIMFFPQGLERFILWGYYGVLMSVGMDWNSTSRIANYYWTPIDWPGIISLLIMFSAIYIVGRTLFVRKEI